MSDTLKKTINIFLLTIVFVFSILNVMYFLHYDVITEHDLYIPWDRTFFKPEHGRYLATYFNNLLTQKLYYTMEIHPNDIQIYIMPFIKGFIISSICALITYSLFIFSKIENKLVSVKITLTYCFYYLLIYLLTFNRFYFFSERQYEIYFNSLENTVFFEYLASLMPYCIFFMYLYYYYTSKKIPPKTLYVFILIITFLLGITVEVINVPVFIALSLIVLIELLNIVRTKNEKTFFFHMLGIYIVYVISFIIYYINPRDNEIFWSEGLTYPQYLKYEFIPFVQDYFINFVPGTLILSVISIIIAYIYFFISKNKTEQDKKFLCLLTISIISIFIYFFLMFIFGHTEDAGIYYIDIPKWQNLYKVICLFHLVITMGYIINKLFKENTSLFVKTIICIILFILFNQNLIFNYYANMQIYRYKYQKIREAVYLLEKCTRENFMDASSINISLPKKYEPYFSSGDTIFNSGYVGNVIQIDIADKDIQINFSDEDAYNNYTEEELRSLVFTRLLDIWK